jgi:hypothetical protein
MVVSASPDFLLATALMIGKNTSNEENFLEVHGGLHYGKVLERGNSYFGSTIKPPSRMLLKQNKKFWCTGAYVNALTDNVPR